MWKSFHYGGLILHQRITWTRDCRDVMTMEEDFIQRRSLTEPYVQERGMPSPQVRTDCAPENLHRREILYMWWMWKCFAWNHQLYSALENSCYREIQTVMGMEVFRQWLDLGRHQWIHIRKVLINERIVGSWMDRHQVSRTESPQYGKINLINVNGRVIWGMGILNCLI